MNKAKDYSTGMIVFLMITCGAPFLTSGQALVNAQQPPSGLDGGLPSPAPAPPPPSSPREPDEPIVPPILVPVSDNGQR